MTCFAIAIQGKSNLCEHIPNVTQKLDFGPRKSSRG